MKNNPEPRIALAQMEVRPGRPEANVERMLQLIARARAREAALVVFPEMCISGYILGDCWEQERIVEDFAAYSQDICAASAGLGVVFGNVAVDPKRRSEDGRLRKYNAAWICADRQWVLRANLPCELPCGIHPKTLHPNYRFFDDDRHFYSLCKLAAEEGASVYDWIVPYSIRLPEQPEFLLGVQLCEDLWFQDYRYTGAPLNTLSAWGQTGVTTVVNLSASPWTWQKNRKRHQVVREALAQASLRYHYVNSVGGQNNGKNVIVFDGGTTSYAADGRIRAMASPWNEDLLLLPDDEDQPPQTELSEMAAIHAAIIAGLKHIDQTLGSATRYLLGVSGGVDSSLVAALLVDAFGCERVFAVNMPTRFNAQQTQDNARQLCTALNIDYLSCPIEALYAEVSALVRGIAFDHLAGEYSGLVDENIQARIRGADVLAGVAAKCGCVFTNNGNKTEVALGYATLYGDINGAIAPIADLYKTQVFGLARYLNMTVYRREVIPNNLLTGEIVPSAELSTAQDITSGLGDPIHYDYHDCVLRQLIEYRQHPMDLMQWYLAGELLTGIGYTDRSRFAEYFPTPADWLTDLDWIATQLRRSVFKRIQAPPIIVLSKRAFGFDLRESQLPEIHPRGIDACRQAILNRSQHPLPAQG